MTTPTQQVQPRSAAMTAAQIAALIALVQAQANLRRQLTQTAVAAALAPFRALGVAGWWDGARVQRAINEVLRIVQPTQVQMARVTDAYLAQAVSTMTGRRAAPAGAVDITRLRRQMTPEVARDLVSGERQVAFVTLGEFDPETGEVEPSERINAPIPLALPDPVTQPSTAAVQRSTRQQAEQLRERARELAQQLERLRAQRAGASTTPAVAAVSPVSTPATSTSTSTGPTRRDALDPGEPYNRVAEQYRYQVVARGSTEAEAQQAAESRLAAIAWTDVTLAVREQVRRTLGSLSSIAGVEGYRRVLRPELSETGPCGLCVVAATRIYTVEDLKPMHDRCVCEVLPIIGDMDPGLFLNDEDLDRIYGGAGQRGGKRGTGRLARMRVVFTEHGELGPILVNGNHSYRGPREVAEAVHPDRRVRLEAQLESAEEQFARLLRREANGENVERPIQWQAARIERLERELAA
jgi:hypothetical protein